MSNELEHRDDEGSRLGMWIFIFSELLLFGGLFLVYAVYRSMYSQQFHEAALELNAFIGVLNTIILLISSMTVAMGITAFQKGNKKLSLLLIALTLILACIFLVNKYFEWGHKFHLHLYPGSDLMLQLEHGHILFFGLYYFMTGLHGLHIIIGGILLAICFFKVKNGSINSDKNVLLINAGLYWHLIDLIWIFLFPLLYLIS
jgi:cytochrome c oxidase subunit III